MSALQHSIRRGRRVVKNAGQRALAYRCAAPPVARLGLHIPWCYGVGSESCDGRCSGARRQAEITHRSRCTARSRTLAPYPESRGRNTPRHPLRSSQPSGAAPDRRQTRDLRHAALHRVPPDRAGPRAAADCGPDDRLERRVQRGVEQSCTASADGALHHA